MYINQDFTQDRSKYLGGSDIGALLGFSKFRTPLEVWLEKTGKKTKKIHSLPVRFGSFAEKFVADEYSLATGHDLLCDESIYLHLEHRFMGAHIDRFVLGNGNNCPPTRILECKTANPFSSGDWGDAGSDGVPMSYLCQCIWYMAITGIEKTDLAVLFGNCDFKIYEISRDLELEALVIQRASSFWNDHVLKDIPPPSVSEADCQLLFGKGSPNKCAQATPETLELIKRLHLLNSEIEIREKELSSIKQSIMGQMGDAELLSYAGQTLATWKAPKPSYRLDAKRLQQEHAELVGQYQIPMQNSRRLVIKHLKGEAA